jgi:hypothetical protein
MAVSEFAWTLGFWETIRIEIDSTLLCFSMRLGFTSVMPPIDDKHVD